MEKPKIYLETTMFNFYYAPDVPGYRVLLESIREIHAIRLKLQDETAGMTPEEIADFYNKKAEAFLAPMGKTLCYDLVGRGRIQQPITQ
jgi:hypothetical protein